MKTTISFFIVSLLGMPKFMEPIQSFIAHQHWEKDHPSHYDKDLAYIATEWPIPKNKLLNIAQIGGNDLGTALLHIYM